MSGGIVMAESRERFAQARAVFREHGGILRMSQALGYGISRHTLYAMVDAGDLERLSRGLYRLADLPPLGSPDLVTVAERVPHGVICLISALSFHDITTQVPHEVHIAIDRNSETPRVDYPPVRVFRFSGKALTEGVGAHTLDGTPVRVYSAAKTVADCFKYRNKIGLDTAIEGLKLYQERTGIDVGELMRFARICRVENVMRPYVEALL